MKPINIFKVFFYSLVMIAQFMVLQLAYSKTPTVLSPDFSASPIFLNPGQPLIPICSSIVDTPSCIKQWSQHAQIMFNSSPGSSTYNPEYFLPTFVSNSTQANAQQYNTDWSQIVIDTSLVNASLRQFYHKSDNPNAIRMTQNGSTQEGSIQFINSNDIRSSNSGQTISYYVEDQGTYGLPASVKETQPGCFVITQNPQTEADFCADCDIRADSAYNILSEFGVNLDTLGENLQATAARTNNNIRGKTGSQMNYENQICSPEISLQQIISNFERTCPAPYNGTGGFEKFFERSFCEACKNSIPPELMMSIMSIESAGRCEAHASNEHENSFGLFQINSEVHQCNGRARNSPENTQCLNNPINNMNVSIDILKKYFKKVNPSSTHQLLNSEASNNQCSATSWLTTAPRDKDAWRRALSAYNSGPGWVTRAIASARNNRTRDGTNYLSGAHLGSSNAKYKEDEASWEDLRLFYFLESLVPSNTRGTGRQIRLTQSNIAYVDSILGRNVRQENAPMIEIWSQYKANFLERKGSTLQCPE